MIPPGCEARCPACAHRELSSSESESEKSIWLARALGRWRETLEPIRAPSGEERWNYRDKSLLHATRSEGGWRFGMRVRRTEEIIPIPNCPVHSRRVRSASAIFSGELAAELLPEMDLRFLVIAGPLLTLVVKSSPQSELSRSGRLEVAIERLSGPLRDAGVTGVFANFNPSAGRRVFSSRGWTHLWGEKWAAGPGGLRHGPQSFQQLIPALFDDALFESECWFAPGQGDFVLDLYSGLGSSLRRWLDRGAESVGVELLGEAARLGPALPGAILQGKVSDRIPQLEDRLKIWRGGHAGSLAAFVNPPRTGLEPGVIEWLASSRVRPGRVAYLSCSAGTLSRDLSKLENCAYRVKRIIPYDFFPQTAHVETLALLELDLSLGVSHPDSGERLRRTE